MISLFRYFYFEIELIICIFLALELVFFLGGIDSYYAITK